MKKKILAIVILLILFFIPDQQIHATSVNLFRLTSGFYREDWPVVHKNLVLWVDSRPGGVYGYDTVSNIEFPFFGENRPPSDLYGLIGFDGKYLVYVSQNEGIFDIKTYNRETKEIILLPDRHVSRGSADFDGKTIVFIEGGNASGGDLYAFNIHNKKEKFITQNAQGPKVSGRYITWYFNVNYPLTDISVYDLATNQFINIPNPDGGGRGAPDIYGNKLVYLYDKDNTTSVRLFDMNKKEETVLVETDAYSITYPTISKGYTIWGVSTSQHVAGVEGVDLTTGTLLEIQEQGPHQNGVIVPVIEDNIAAWMAWRTGNGDIYASILNH